MLLVCRFCTGSTRIGCDGFVPAVLAGGVGEVMVMFVGTDWFGKSCSAVA